jgi:hypothetical protein
MSALAISHLLNSGGTRDVSSVGAARHCSLNAEAREFFIEQPPMHTELSSGIGLVTVGRLQRLLDKVAFPTFDRLAERHCFGGLSIEDAGGRTLLSR